MRPGKIIFLNLVWQLYSQILAQHLIFYFWTFTNFALFLPSLLRVSVIGIHLFSIFFHTNFIFCKVFFSNATKFAQGYPGFEWVSTLPWQLCCENIFGKIKFFHSLPLQLYYYQDIFCAFSHLILNTSTFCSEITAGDSCL